MENGGASLVTINKANEKAVGSPYLNENFLPARASISSEVYYVRYNIFADEFEAKVDNIKMFNKNTDHLTITMVNDNTTFGAIDFVDKKAALSRGYFLFLTENSNAKVKLYEKKQIKYIEAKPAVTGYDKDKPAEFRQIGDIYYVSIDNAAAQTLPKKKKDLVKLFPNHSTAIENFIKSNKIKTSKQEDLIKLIAYINTL